MSQSANDPVSRQEPIVSPGIYLIIYAALMGLLVLTIGFSFVDFGPHGSILIALSIATAKAVLIAWFFMHLGYGPKLTWVFALAGFLWLGIMITLTMSDYLTRNHPRGDSPRGEPHFLEQPIEK